MSQRNWKWSSLSPYIALLIFTLVSLGAMSVIGCALVGATKGTVQESASVLATAIAEKQPTVVVVVTVVYTSTGLLPATPEPQTRREPAHSTPTPVPGAKRSPTTTPLTGKPLHRVVENPLTGLRVEAQRVSFGPDYVDVGLHIQRTGDILAEPFFYAPYLRDQEGHRYDVDSDSLDEAHFALLGIEAKVTLRFRVPDQKHVTLLKLVLNGQSTEGNKVAPRMELRLEP